MNGAEQLLHNLGVARPEDIDLEAIAHLLGVKIRYLPLDGCEARITGNGDRAVIAVNSRSPMERQRFSIGHELGHWAYHRNRVLICKAADIGGLTSKAKVSERTADRYAADLLMPRYLFDLAVHQRRLDFGLIKELAAQFGSSLTATAIRAVETRGVYALLVCHGKNGRRWFRRSPDVPERWFPQDTLDSASYAFDVLFGSGPANPSPMRIPAEAWVDSREASRYQIREQSIHAGSGQILTLLLLDAPGMLEDR